MRRRRVAATHPAGVVPLHPLEEGRRWLGEHQLVAGRSNEPQLAGKLRILLHLEQKAAALTHPRAVVREWVGNALLLTQRGDKVPDLLQPDLELPAVLAQQRRFDQSSPGQRPGTGALRAEDRGVHLGSLPPSFQPPVQRGRRDARSRRRRPLSRPLG